MDGVYLTAVAAEGDLGSARMLFVAGFLAATALAALVGSIAPDERRVPVLAGAAGGLIALGSIAIFSIGAPLLVAGFLAATGAFKGAGYVEARTLVYTAVAAVAVGTAFALGLRLTE